MFVTLLSRYCNQFQFLRRKVKLTFFTLCPPFDLQNFCFFFTFPIQYYYLASQYITNILLYIVIFFFFRSTKTSHTVIMMFSNSYRLKTGNEVFPRVPLKKMYSTMRLNKSHSRFVNVSLSCCGRCYQDAPLVMAKDQR